MVVPRRPIAALAALAACACAPPAAAEPSIQPSAPPEDCRGMVWADQIGTNGVDHLSASARAERLWGLAGADTLRGSATRAACLFGGRDDDLLDLGDGGGIAWGESGADTLRGGARSDRFDGGSGIDGFAGGPSDDKFDTADGHAEVVDCGPGNDIVHADRADLLLHCESLLLDGRPTPSLSPEPRAAQASAIVRVRYRVPDAAGAGAYRILLVTGAREPGCANGPLEITRFPAPGRRVRRGQEVRVGLRPPEGGWCRGVSRAVVVLHRRCRSKRCAAPPPAQPVARLRFSASR